MEITICPYCKTRVMPKADGSCPSCQGSLTSAPPLPKSSLKCPSCSAPLPFHAVLCVACGYHLKTGVQLATLGDDTRTELAVAPMPLSDPEQVASAPRPVDLNPYAPPGTHGPIDPFPEDDRFAADLTIDGERRARAVVSDAEFVWTAMIFSFLCCWPAWLLELPWYCYRLYSWHCLNREFAELRHPNSLSQHGDLAARFQDAKPRIWIGIGAGIAGWILIALAAVVSKFLP